MSALDHRLWVSLARAPERPVPACVRGADGGLRWWGWRAPAALAAALAPGEQASAAALYPRGSLAEGAGLPEAPPPPDHPGGAPPTAAVVIGVVDHGLPLGHPAFGGPEGLAVEALLDRRGRVWERGALLAGLRGGPLPPPGPTDHGAGVASLAAGRPFAGFPGGAAPSAGLIVATPDTWQEAGGWELHPGGVEAAVDFFERRAAGRPRVLLLALERHAGPGDGGGPLARRLRRFVRDGGSVVAAGGNYRGLHALYRLAPGPAALSWEPAGEGPLELWYRPGDRPLRARIQGLEAPPPGGGPAVALGGAWVTHLRSPPEAPGWAALSLTAAAPLELTLDPGGAAELRLRRPAPLQGRLVIAPPAEGLGAVGEPALLPEIGSAGTERTAQGVALDGRPVPQILLPDTHLAAVHSASLVGSFSGSSAAAAVAAGRLAALLRGG